MYLKTDVGNKNFELLYENMPKVLKTQKSGSIVKFKELIYD